MVTADRMKKHHFHYEYSAGATVIPTVLRSPPPVLGKGTTRGAQGPKVAPVRPCLCRKEEMIVCGANVVPD